MGIAKDISINGIRCKAFFVIGSGFSFSIFLLPFSYRGLRDKEMRFLVLVSRNNYGADIRYRHPILSDNGSTAYRMLLAPITHKAATACLSDPMAGPSHAP